MCPERLPVRSLTLLFLLLTGVQKSDSWTFVSRTSKLLILPTPCPNTTSSPVETGSPGNLRDAPRDVSRRPFRSQTETSVDLHLRRVSVDPLLSGPSLIPRHSSTWNVGCLNLPSSSVLSVDLHLPVTRPSCRSHIRSGLRCRFSTKGRCPGLSGSHGLRYLFDSVLFSAVCGSLDVFTSRATRTADVQVQAACPVLTSWAFPHLLSTSLLWNPRTY